MSGGTPGFGSTDPNDWIRRLIDEDQGLGFNTFLKEQNLAPGIERFLRTQSGRIQDDFGAHLGRQIAAGTVPEDSFFHDFLRGGRGGFNIQEYLSRFSPESKGLGTRAFDPRTSYRF